jgi:hypothetical protein
MVQDLHRAIAALALQLSHEYQSLTFWQTQLKLQTTYEETHGDTGRLPELRRECAATHCRVLEIQRRLADAHARLRTLSGGLGHSEGRN